MFFNIKNYKRIVEVPTLISFDKKNVGGQRAKKRFWLNDVKSPEKLINNIQFHKNA